MNRFEIVEDQQAAPLTKKLHQPPILSGPDQVGWHAGGDGADGLVEQLGERRPILQRAEQHQIKLGQHLVGKRDRQARFADPAEPDDRNHPAAVVHDPLVQRWSSLSRPYSVGTAIASPQSHDRRGIVAGRVAVGRTGDMLSPRDRPLVQALIGNTLWSASVRANHTSSKAGSGCGASCAACSQSASASARSFPGVKAGGAGRRRSGAAASQPWGRKAGLPLLHAAPMHADRSASAICVSAIRVRMISKWLPRS